MNIYINTITAVRALRRNKLRSGLSMIGIIIGISSVIAMMGLGNSARLAVEERIYSYGVNAMSIKLKNNRYFSSTDIITMARYIPQIRYITPMDYVSEKDIRSIHRYRQKNYRARIYFTNEDYFYMQTRSIRSGRLFNEHDILSSARVAVIGTTVEKKLFGHDDPVGKIITINNNPFTVIGVMDEKGEALSGRDFDNITVIPYTSGLQRFNSSASFNEINISTYHDYEIKKAKELVTKYVTQKYLQGSNIKSSLKISTSDDKLKMAQDITKALSILLAGIASISLFVGGVGIMNIMLVSVTERTREIGIRMAIGAKKADIMLQFLLEAVFLSSFGGSGGILLGIGLYYAVTYFVQWPFIFSMFSIAVSFLFSAAVGIFFGYYPSRRAADLKPIDALKYE